MDVAQFKEEIFCLKDLLYRLALRLLNNTPDAEDAVQQTMMKMWQRKDELNQMENVKAFVIKVLKNDCLNRLKKSETDARHEGNFGKMQSHKTEVATGNMLDIIRTEISKLPKKQKMIIQLADVEGFESKEIAGILDIEEGAVRTNLSRARQKVKIQIMKLQEYEEEDDDELTDKFFAGKATRDEIRFLKSEGLISKQDLLYVEALSEDRAETMNFEFDDLMRLVEQPEKTFFPAKRIWLNRIIAAAAVGLLVLLVSVFWPEQQPAGTANAPSTPKPAENNSPALAQMNPPADSQQELEKSAKTIRTNVTKSAKPPKTFEKNRKPQKSIENKPPEEGKALATDENFLVMVNGKPVNDRSEALAITKQSLTMISHNLTTTVDELKPLAEIKIKL